jgi:hypothetical protein
MKANIIVLLTTVVLAAPVAHGASVIDTTHTWDGADPEGWGHTAAEGLVSLASTNGQLEVVHKAQSIPAFVADTVRRWVPSGALVSKIAFTLQATDVSPSRVRLQLHSAGSGALWQLVLSVPAIGETRSYTAPVTFADGWSKGAYSTEARFLQDLRSIDWLGVEILRHASTGSQSYALDEFRIQGVQFTGDADMDYMADAWELTHGLDTNDFTDAGLDADSDGMSNYAEFRAGSDPELFSSRFEARVDTIEGATGVSFELQWDSRSDRGYTVWRSTNLLSGFTRLATGELGDPPTNVFRDVTATNAATYFYRIEVEPEF